MSIAITLDHCFISLKDGTLTLPTDHSYLIKGSTVNVKTLNMGDDERVYRSYFNKTQEECEALGFNFDTEDNNSQTNY